MEMSSATLMDNVEEYEQEEGGDLETVFMQICSKRSADRTLADCERMIMQLKKQSFFENMSIEHLSHICKTLRCNVLQQHQRIKAENDYFLKNRHLLLSGRIAVYLKTDVFSLENNNNNNNSNNNNNNNNGGAATLRLTRFSSPQRSFGSMARISPMRTVDFEEATLEISNNNSAIRRKIAQFPHAQMKEKFGGTCYPNQSFFGFVTIANTAENLSSIEALEPSVLLEISVEDYDKIIGNTSLNVDDTVDFLKRMGGFNHVPIRHLGKIAQALKPVMFNEGEVLYEQGDTTNGMYWIRMGSCQMYKEAPSRKKRDRRFVKEIRVGELLGSHEVLFGKQRRHTVIAQSETHAFFLNAKEINQKEKRNIIGGPVLEALAELAGRFEQSLTAAMTGFSQTSVYSIVASNDQNHNHNYNNFNNNNSASNSPRIVPPSGWMSNEEIEVEKQLEAPNDEENIPPLEAKDFEEPVKDGSETFKSLYKKEQLELQQLQSPGSSPGHSPNHHNQQQLPPSASSSPKRLPFGGGWHEENDVPYKLEESSAAAAVAAQQKKDLFVTALNLEGKSPPPPLSKGKSRPSFKWKNRPELSVRDPGSSPAVPSETTSDDEILFDEPSPRGPAAWGKKGKIPAGYAKVSGQNSMVRQRREKLVTSISTINKGVQQLSVEHEETIPVVRRLFPSVARTRNPKQLPCNPAWLKMPWKPSHALAIHDTEWLPPPVPKEPWSKHVPSSLRARIKYVTESSKEKPN